MWQLFVIVILIIIIIITIVIVIIIYERKGLPFSKKRTCVWQVADIQLFAPNPPTRNTRVFLIMITRC